MMERSDLTSTKAHKSLEKSVGPYEALRAFYNELVQMAKHYEDKSAKAIRRERYSSWTRSVFAK